MCCAAQNAYRMKWFIVLLLCLGISTISKAQECNPNYSIKARWFDPDSPIRYSLSAGMCYHYDGFAVGLHYDKLTLQTVLMRPARYRTMRMQEEAYIVAGYDSRLGIGGGIRLNDNRVSPVGYISAKQKLFGSLYGNVAYYQTMGMSHLVVGLKLMI